MIDDDKNEEGAPEIIGEDDLHGVTGGRRTTPTTVTGKFTGNDTIVGISKEDVLRDTKDGFNIGMPPYIKKK